MALVELAVAKSAELKARLAALRALQIVESCNSNWINTDGANVRPVLQASTAGEKAVACRAITAASG
jgi:hypothetical protein